MRARTSLLALLLLAASAGGRAQGPRVEDTTAPHPPNIQAPQAGGATPPPHGASTPAPHAGSTTSPHPARARGGVDGTTLPRLLRAAGLSAPSRFKALVVVLPHRGEGTPAALRGRDYDWYGTSTDRGDWWPASTVKLFAAIAALERTRALGFSPQVDLLFHDDGTLSHTRMDALLQQALIPSNNYAYDRLVSIVGYDEINDRFFTARNGLSHTRLERSYGFHDVAPDGSNVSLLRHSPAVTLKEGARVREAPRARRHGPLRLPGRRQLHDPRRPGRGHAPRHAPGGAAALAAFHPRPR